VAKVMRQTSGFNCVRVDPADELTFFFLFSQFFG
jgi:hypothetical protein